MFLLSQLILLLLLVAVERASAKRCETVIPSLSKSTKMIDKRVCDEGKVPATIGKLTNLEQVHLYDTADLSGTIPREIGRLTKLRELWLFKDPKLSGKIPTEVGTLTSLEYLTFGGTTISGPIPTELGTLSSIQQLWLPETEISSGIPTEIGNLANLQVLALYKNDKLRGTIPASFGKLQNLTRLELSDLVGLSGTISQAAIGGLVKLSDLKLHATKISGVLPFMGDLQNLRNVYLPETAAPPKTACDNTCAVSGNDRAYNDDCEDGFGVDKCNSDPADGKVAIESDCPYGTDCADCGGVGRPQCPKGSEMRKTPSSLVFQSRVGGLTTCANGSSVAKEGYACYKCGPGKYNFNAEDSLGRSHLACKACANGQYAEETGATKCKACGVGKFNGLGGARGAPVPACFSCSSGTYQDEQGLSACKPCASGRFNAAIGQTSDSACTACSAGQYQMASGEAFCIMCGAGKYSALKGAKSDACLDCDAGRYSRAQGLAEASDCNACPLGQYGSLSGATRLDDCSLCKAGKFGNTSGASEASKCYACKAGVEYSDQSGQPACKSAACRAGTYGIATATNVKPTCVDCAQGKFSSAQGLTEGADCSMCPLGRWGSSQGATRLEDCTKCVSGKFGNTSGASEASKCYACKVGIDYTDEAGQPACKSAACPPGTFARGGGGIANAAPTCADCQAGRYSTSQGLTEASDCSACPLGRYGSLSGATRLDDCSLCKAGKFGNTSGASEASKCYACKAGVEYSDQSGQPACKSAACRAGTYGIATATTNVKPTCVDCAQGKFSSAQGLTEGADCSDCPLGQFGIGKGSTSLQTACRLCPALKYGFKRGQASESLGCENCPTGQWQDESGRASCKPASCPPGKWGETHPNCNPCKPGRYSPSPGIGSPESCLDCPAGRYGKAEGASALEQCKLCPAGTFGAAQSLTAAECTGPCPVGHYSIAGLTECLECTRGWKASSNGSLACTECPAGMTTRENGAHECVCAPGRFKNLAGKCALCLTDEMDCSGQIGLTVQDVKVKAGFWRSNNATSNILMCPVADACVNSTCAPGHQGPLCMACSQGFSRWRRSGVCEPCPKSVGWGIVRSILFLLLCLILLIIFLRLNRKAPSGVIKPFINGSQMIQVLLMFDVDWPKSFSQLAAAVGGLNLDAVSITSPSCMGISFNYYRRLSTMVVLTVVITSAPWIRDLIKHAFRRQRALRETSAASRLNRRWSSAFHTSFGHRLRDLCLIILLIHPTLSGYAFGFFNCKFIEETGGVHVLNKRSGNYYMVADYGLKCYDSAYNGMMVLAVAVVVFFSFGIPLLFAFVLYKRREALDSPATKQYLGMLYLSYKPECYWFESVQMLFKLALWASLTFLKDDPQVKIALAQFICFAQVALHARLRPFNSQFKNTIQAFSVCLAFAVGFGGLVINYLRVSMREAFLLSNADLATVLQGKLDAFKTFLEIVLYCSFVTYGIVALRRAKNVARKNRDKIPLRLRCCCPCWSFREDPAPEHGGSSSQGAGQDDGIAMVAPAMPQEMPHIPAPGVVANPTELVPSVLHRRMPSEELSLGGDGSTGSGGGIRLSSERRLTAVAGTQKMRSASGRMVDFEGPNTKTNPMYE